MSDTESTPDHRAAAEHTARDRILYSEGFWRLGGVTQAAYLLALAVAHDGRFVTFDRALVRASVPATEDHLTVL